MVHARAAGGAARRHDGLRIMMCPALGRAARALEVRARAGRRAALGRCKACARPKGSVRGRATARRARKDCALRRGHGPSARRTRCEGVTMARLPRGEDCVLVGRGGAAAHPARVRGSDTARPARTGGAPACHAQRAAAQRGAARDRGEAALGRGRARTRPGVAVRQAGRQAGRQPIGLSDRDRLCLSAVGEEVPAESIPYT